MKLLSEREILDMEFQEKLEENKRIAEEKTNKKREKRQKKKSKSKNKAKKPKIEEQKSEDEELLSGSDKEGSNDDENSQEATVILPAEKEDVSIQEIVSTPHSELKEQCSVKDPANVEEEDK
jgi:hypothetical protein